MKIQTKLTVSEPGDRYEQEADRVADAVMGGAGAPVSHVSQGVQPKLYRREMRPEDLYDSALPATEEGETETPAETPAETPTEEVQRSANGEAGAVTPSFEQSLGQAARGGGESLPEGTRSFMESRFGWNFSSVRVHSDERANALARQVNARAFTIDRDIFFANSQYRPQDQEGRRLLAHELTHVVQQSEGRIARQVQRQTSCSSYPGYNTSASLSAYNCSGLATRTYRNIGSATGTYTAIGAEFIGANTPSGGSCGGDEVKFWLWEYDMHTEDDTGARLAPNHRDFHVVAGQADASGADPTDVYSKNGFRLVHGPASGPSWQPATRERSLSNDASETPVSTRAGRPVFKVRSNMSEHITCAACHP
ncbi:MAG TPA: DUF4157 domain-containing protein [Pyrinomonadaceae bacterium]